MGKNKEIIDAELWAIAEALEIANRTVIVRNIPVIIFCDSQRALNAIALPFTCQEHRFLGGLIHQKTGELQNNGHHITFRWVPSHSGLLGNEKADLAAKKKSRKRWKTDRTVELTGIYQKKCDRNAVIRYY